MVLKLGLLGNKSNFTNDFKKDLFISSIFNYFTINTFLNRIKYVLIGFLSYFIIIIIKSLMDERSQANPWHLSYCNKQFNR